MKRNKTYLISALIVSTYDLYIIVRTIYYLFNKDTYGNVYFEFMFYPHLIFILLGTIFNYILYFKDNNKLKIATLVSYILAIIFLFINK